MIEDPAPQNYNEALHLAFDTEVEAIAAEAQISSDCGFVGEITTRWDTPRQCSDGRWIIQKPPTQPLPFSEPPVEL